MADICITGALAKAIGERADPDESVKIQWPAPDAHEDLADEEVWCVIFGGEQEGGRERAMLFNDQTGAVVAQIGVPR